MPQPRTHSAPSICLVVIIGLHVTSSAAGPIGVSATASTRRSYAAGAVQPQREHDQSGEVASGPEILSRPDEPRTPRWRLTRTLLGVNQAAKQLLHRHSAPSNSEAAVTEAEAVSSGYSKPSRSRQLLSRLQSTVGLLTNKTAASGSELSTVTAQTTSTVGDPLITASGNTHAVATADKAIATNATAEAHATASLISNTGHPKISSNGLLNLVQQLVHSFEPDTTSTTSTNITQANLGELLYDLTLDDSDLGTLRSDLGTLDATDPLQGYSDQAGLLQHQTALPPANATFTAALEQLLGAVAALAGRHWKPRGPVTDWPAVPPGWVNPRPPCSNGMVQQDNRCVCPPGSGTNDAHNGCVRCPLGWVSVGGPLWEARCIPCPQLTISNAANTACVIAVNQPDVNQALCKTCFDPAKPFATPACCPKGQVCCGTYGCCSSNLCINNATTNNQPFCCEASSPPCPGTTGLQFGLNCCQKGTTCLNSTTPTCCPLKGVCVGSSPANTKCCNPPQTSTCAVDRSGLALCCAGPFCPNSGTSGNGECCDVDAFCVEQRKCCKGANAQICRSPASTNKTLAETCCATDSLSTCISSPVNPGLSLCCSTTNNSFVCGNDCCNRDTQQCVNQAECCDSDRVCPSPINPNVEICCGPGLSCDPATNTCL